MASVYLVSAALEDSDRFPAFALDDLERIKRSAERDKHGVHKLTDDPETADLILFVERAHATGRYMEAIRRHPLLKKYRDKCFIYNSRYFGVPFLPGVYGCVRKRDFLYPQRMCSGHYLEVCERDELEYQEPLPNPPYLYSFVGAVNTWPSVRAPLSRLSHPRGYFVDTSEERKRLEAEGVHADKTWYTQRYVDVVRKSKFVLCPRGDAVGSMRLFESMKMGRVPVIIADQWVNPRGPDWESFSIRIREKDIPTIPRVLEEMEDRALEMGIVARKVWEEWFSEEVSFHWAVEWCLEIMEKRKVPESIMRFAVPLGLLMPFHLRRYLGTRVHLYKTQGKLIL